MRVQRFLTTGLVSLGLALPGMAQTPPKQLTIATAAASGSYLGVNLQDISADRAKALKLPEEEGVEITRVEANSPAATAGLQSGDAVVEYNGQRVEGIEQFSRLVRETPAGREVKLKIFRNGSAQTVAAKIGSHNVGLPSVSTVQPFNGGALNGGAWPDSMQTFMSTWRSSGLGVEVEALSGQLADYFGVKEGVLVRSVMKDSAADKAGVKAGDVIVKAGESKIATPADLTSRIRPSLRRQAVALTLMRDHKEVTVNVQGEGTARAEQ